MSMRRDAYWTAADTIISSGLAFVLRLVVARILAPEDFGVAAIAVTLVGILGTINDFGLTAALIQRDRKDVTRDFVDTTFTASLMITLALAAITAFLIAPLAAAAYAEPQLYGLILALAVTLLPSPFTTVAASRLMRQRRFRETAIIKVTSTFVGMGAALVLLLVDPSPWVIVLQVLASALTSAALFQIANPYRYRLRLDRGHLKSVFGFSGFVLMSDMIGNMQANAGVFLLGLAVSTSAVGQFAFAVYLTDTARRIVMSVLNRVTFVHFSQNKHDHAYLRERFAATVQWNCRALFPLMVAMMLFGPAWSVWFLGPEWSGIGPVIFWLSLTVIVGTAGGATANLFKSMGRPGMDLALGFATTIVLLLPSIYLAGRAYGLEGAAVAVFAVKVIAVCLRLTVLERVLPGALGRTLANATFQFALQAPIFVAWGISRLAAPLPITAEFALLVVALAVYAFIEVPRTFPDEWRMGRRWLVSVSPFRSHQH